MLCYIHWNTENNMQLTKHSSLMLYIWLKLEIIVLDNNKVEKSKSKNKIVVYHWNLKWCLAQNRALIELFLKYLDWMKAILFRQNSLTYSLQQVMCLIFTQRLANFKTFPHPIRLLHWSLVHKASINISVLSMSKLSAGSDCEFTLWVRNMEDKCSFPPPAPNLNLCMRDSKHPCLLYQMNSTGLTECIFLTSQTSVKVHLGINLLGNLVVLRLFFFLWLWLGWVFQVRSFAAEYLYLYYLYHKYYSINIIWPP